MGPKETPSPRSAGAEEGPALGRTREIFLVFLKLGCTSFGGPAAHLGYFQQEFVATRRWIDGPAYADTVALCQFLPGPASSQVGLALGWRRGGWKGAVAAWLGFTAPSVAIMVALAYGMEVVRNLGRQGWVQGLKVAAVSVVAQAVLAMARHLCPDAARVAIAGAVAAFLTWCAAPWSSLAGLAAGALAGFFLRPWLDLGPVAPGRAAGKSQTFSGGMCLGLFFALLLVLPWLARSWPSPPAILFDRLYRTGALVFGGGHVVLPLLQRATVARGWIGQDAFLAGYGAAQALPGPLFAFSSYLGVLMPPGGLGGAFLAVAAIYLPGVLVLFGVLPFWDRLKTVVQARALLAGANAAVVGLLAAALYDPIAASTLVDVPHLALAVAGFAALQFGRIPPWAVVAACAAVGALAFR